MISRILAPAAAIVGGLALVGLSAVAWTADPPAAQPSTRPAAVASSEATEARAQLDRNLKAILLAMHNYESANASFPPPAIRSPDGRPLLSWRVAMLPYLDQSALYGQFHLDEPWDSPHNRPLADRMPAVFATPGFPAAVGRTRFRLIEAAGALFGPPPAGAPGGGLQAEAGGMSAEMGEAPREAAQGAPAEEPKEEPPAEESPRFVIPPGVSLANIFDGSSNTVAVVVAEDPVEWSRPGELVIPGGLQFPGTSSYPALAEDGPEGYILGMADASVRRLPDSPNRRGIILPALLTVAGGEVVDSGVFAPEPPHVEAKAAASEPKAPAAFERRLRRVEEKLDEILERLDAPAKP